MIGPVSTTGQAMMQSLQNAMSKGMPVDQAIAYVKSLAMDGIAPLTDLYAMMMQFQRLKEPTRRTPEGGNIRQQLESFQNPQPQPQQQDPMAMGLGGMDAGAMENPSFAGGGIVAFDQGGVPQSAPAGITPQLYGQVPQFKTWEEAAAAYRAQMQDPALVEAEMERRKALAEKYEFGEFGKSMDLREAQVAADKDVASRIGAEEAQFDEDEYWEDVAVNAAESGATLLTSLSKAQRGKTKRKRATAEKARTAIREARQTEILLEQAREAERAGRYKEAEALRTRAAEKAEGAQGKIADAKVAADESAYSRETQLLVARAQKGERDQVLGELSRKLSRLDPDSPEFASVQKQFNAVNSTTAAAQIRAAGAGAKPDPAVLEEIRTLRVQLTPLALLQDTDPRKQRILNRLDALYGKLSRQGVTAEDVEAELAGGTQQGSAGLPPGFQPIR